MLRVARFALPWLLLSCERATPPAPAPPPPVDVTAPRDAPFARPDVAAVSDVAAAEGPAVTPTAPARVDVNATSVDRLVALPDGAVLLRAMNREGQRTTEIIATRLDAQGLAAGVPRLLRRTSGPVVALDASVADGALWVAWGSVRPVDEARGDHLVAALRVRADLSSVERPITLQDFRAMVGGDGEMAPQAINRLEVGVLASAGGGAVVVSSAPVTRCDHGEGDHAERTPCRGWSIARIAADGRVQREGDAAIAHTAGPTSLVAIPGGFAFAVSNDHIGSKTVIDVRPLEAGGRLPFTGDECWHYRDARLARLGDSLLALATPTEGDMAPSSMGHARVLGPQSRLTRLRRDAHGSPEWPAVRTRALRCQGGRPVIELRWAGGGATLDPIRDGAPLDWSAWVARSELPGLEGAAATPPLAWTGQMLVAWDAGGWNRYRCGPRGIVPATP